MQSTSEGCLNIAELANQLRREKIFIDSERKLLQGLNEEVENTTLDLLQSAWICSMQRQNLTNLITSRCEADSVAACQRASLLDGTTFIEGHKVFKFKELNALAELLGWLRDSPYLISLCLLFGEDYIPPSFPSALVAGLYGSCRSTFDRSRMLAVIRTLIKHQLAPSPDPRKLFRSNKCALAQLFAVFRDGHTPARQFLLAALSSPVMSILHEDEFFLDIDPDKAMERFLASDRLKKFGETNSAEYQAKVSRYRKWTIQSLYNLTSQFILSLRENWASFPSAIAWIVQQMVHLLKQHSRLSDRDIHALCTDIILTNYICPAIVNPEAHGVVEVPVSYIARSNLIQIAQILQVLASVNSQEIDPKVRDLYAKFDRNCVSSLIQGVACGSSHLADSVPAQEHPLRTEPPPSAPLAFYTAPDMNHLINFLKRISSKLNNNTPSVTSVDSSSSSAIAEAAGFNEAYSDGSSSSSEGCAASLSTLLQNIEPNYRSRLHDLLKKMPDMSKINTTPPPDKEPSENGHIKKSILAKVPKPRIPRSGSANSALSLITGEEKANEEEKVKEYPQVIMIRLAVKEDSDYVGLLPESKVLESYYGGSEAGDADETASALAVAGPGAPVQKRTRFSVSHDEVSLGNTSDNLEAVSEAASNHSVTSSLELETEDQNDNLSDMVSANVSGRGSPNISGRETPSSQVTDGDAAPDSGHRRIPQNVPVNQTSNAQKLLKQTRNDIEDKFCKFEIKKLMEGDETISIMSDAWSTDVLASDSETIGDADQTQIAANQGTSSSNTIAPDVSETASESAWSMDVLASDSDRNTEVDTDDCVSVAARSDTSWTRRPSHHEESTPPGHVNQNSKIGDVGSPRHMARSNMPRNGSYLSATAQLSRGGELDLVARSPSHNFTTIENRKSILVNGCPVMTCYATSAPESPSTSAPAQMPNEIFDYESTNGYGPQSESTLEDGTTAGDYATSQWVDDSFPQAHASPPDDNYNMPSTSKPRQCYEHEDMMERSMNSSDSSFNAPTHSRHFDSGIDADRQETESRSTITDLVTRMSSATISTSANLVNNITSRIVKSEIRTSIVSISSSRIDKKTPGNMSISSLSVNSAETSVSDKSSSQDVNSEIVTERRVSPPPQKPSTGAIPKSISFDSTAEKSQRRRFVGEDALVSNLDDLKNNMKRSGGNFLHKIRMFRHKGRSHNHTNGNDIKVYEEEQRTEEASLARLECGESSDDILAKYRRKISSESTRGRRGSRRGDSVQEMEIERCDGVVDLNDPEVFNSMKRKLRMVLSNPDLHCVEYVPNRCASASLSEWVRAASVCAGNEQSAAHAGALWRALATSGAAATRLAAELRTDLAARRPYATYLASCRAALAQTLHELNRQVSSVRSESEWCARAAAAARALDQLERSSVLQRLHGRLTRRDPLQPADTELMDERASRLAASINAIIAEVKADPSWDGASPVVVESADVTVERAVFARLYLHVMFPNGDVDIDRDNALSKHIERLCASGAARTAGLSPRHAWAAPFPRAQVILRRLYAFRAPRDKLACIMRCVKSIMAVLGLSEGTEPSADDLTPVLIYVILRVNPLSLLSTVEMVNALGGAALRGEAAYWWTQFCAAIAYIKTMDYTS